MYFFLAIIYGSIIKPTEKAANHDDRADYKNKVLDTADEALYLISDYDQAKVPDDFVYESAEDDYQPPLAIARLFNHDDIIKNIVIFERSRKEKLSVP